MFYYTSSSEDGSQGKSPIAPAGWWWWIVSTFSQKGRSPLALLGFREAPGEQGLRSLGGLEQAAAALQAAGSSAVQAAPAMALSVQGHP